MPMRKRRRLKVKAVMKFVSYKSKKKEKKKFNRFSLKDDKCYF